jgi:hypothetical protein
MRVIKTTKYKVILAQIGEENVVGVEQYPITTEDTNNLPVIGIEDLPNILEDEIEEIPEIPTIPEGIEEKQIEEETPEGYPQFATNDDTLGWAEKNNEVVRINYITKKGRQLIRNIEPHGQFYASTTHHQILVAFDRTVNAIRAFIVRGIKNIDFTGDEKFKKRFVVSTIR